MMWMFFKIYSLVYFVAEILLKFRPVFFAVEFYLRSWNQLQFQNRVKGTICE